MDNGRFALRYHQMRLVACAVIAASLTLLGMSMLPRALPAAGVVALVGVHALWSRRRVGRALETLLVDTTAVIAIVALIAPPIFVGLAPVVVLTTAAALFFGDLRALGVAAYVTVGVSAALTWSRNSLSVEWTTGQSIALVVMAGIALAPMTWWLLQEAGHLRAERQALEQRLRDRESRYRVIAENVSDAIITTDDQGFIVYANPAAERIFGYAPEDLAGQDLCVLIPERYRAAHRLAMVRYVSTGERQRDWNGMALVGLHRDGRELDLEVSFGESNAPEGRRFIGTFRDTTERREADKALRESEARYRGLFEGVPVGVYRTSVAGEILDANPMLAEMVGYADPADLIGLPAQDFYVEPSARETWRENIEELSVLAGHEVQLRHVGGSTIWVRDSGREVRDEDGRLLGYEGTLEDVTLWRQAEDRLHSMVEEERRRLMYEKALSACSHALLVGTDDDALEEALKALHQATGVSEVFVDRNESDSDLGLTTNLLCEVNALEEPPEYERWSGVPWREMPEALAKLSNGEAYTFWTQELTGRESELYEGSMTKSELDIPIFIAGQWEGVIGFADFEEQRSWRQDEIALLRTAAEMIGAFWERRQAHERLQDLVRYKDEFVASVSHELRTPLTAVVGLAEELSGFAPETFSSEELTEFHRLIAQQSREVASIVEDLLVAARVDIDKVSVDIQPVDLDAEIGATIEGWNSEFGEVVYVPGDIKVLADATRLRQIVRNLLTNAIRYGGDSVHVVTDRSDGWGILQVRDDGPGVPPDDLERIFQPYERAGDGAPTKSGSVGLGLYVSRKLAHLMNGELTCHRDGLETVFDLRLPTL